jgi:hypothetical protein
MGGTGNEPHFTNEYLSLDVRWLQRQRVLAPGRGFKLQSARDGELLATVEVPAAGPDPPPPGARRRMGGKVLRGALGVDTLHLWRRAGVVSLPGGWLRAARGDPVRRPDLRLSALLRADLPYPATGGLRALGLEGGEDPGAAGLAEQVQQRQAEGDALAHVRAAGGHV